MHGWSFRDDADSDGPRSPFRLSGIDYWQSRHSIVGRGGGKYRVNGTSAADVVFPSGRGCFPVGFQELGRMIPWMLRPGEVP